MALQIVSSQLTVNPHCGIQYSIPSVEQRNILALLCTKQADLCTYTGQRMYLRGGSAFSDTVLKSKYMWKHTYVPIIISESYISTEFCSAQTVYLLSQKSVSNRLPLCYPFFIFKHPWQPTSGTVHYSSGTSWVSASCLCHLRQLSLLKLQWSSSHSGYWRCWLHYNHQKIQGGEA